jgi:S1-C subfamily serine protease
MICDLVLYLETGIAGERHLSFGSGIAATTTETAAGLQVTHIVPSGFADSAGMRPGDALLWMNRVPIFGISELAVVVREHAPGTEIAVEFVRNGEVHRGRAPLSAWNFGTGEYVGHPGGYPKPALTAAESKR